MPSPRAPLLPEHQQVCTMDASSGPPHLGRQAPPVDRRNVDNDTLNEIQEMVSSTSIDALQSSPSSSNVPSEPGTSSKSLNPNPLKTQIFLSHSGAQKPFIEQLNEDLRQEGYLTFFDRDPGALPEGKNFRPLIFQAAKECDVAVVVLSQEYLLSRWPMMELAAFVDAKNSGNTKMEILPLFYKLGVSALKHDEELHRKMSKTWQEFAEKDDEIDPKKWGKAVRILGSISGQVFDNVCEVAYRKKIVTSIYNLCLPPIEFDLTEMKGKERLCSLVAGELEMTLEERETAILGRYGMGGLGKTMLCKALCMHYRQKFGGRVCYVDFGSGDVLEMKKEILRRVTDLRNKFRLNKLRHKQEIDEALNLYLPQQEVFVAIDNLPPEFATRSMAFLGSLSKGSMCIVTARSPYTLSKMDAILEATNIKPIPSLTEEEAMTFFLHVALPERPLSSLSSEEREIVSSCVHRCVLNRSKSLFFADFRVPAKTVYHPLALVALANCKKLAKSLDPLKSISEKQVSEEVDDDDTSSMYKIIEKLYMTLNDAKKVLFMDVAVFAPREKLFDRKDLLKWLAGVHDKPIGMLYPTLKELQSMSFLEISEESVKMHDFYIDFAHYQMRSNPDGGRQPFVFKAGGNSLPLSLESTPARRFREELVRVKLEASSNHSNPLGSICYVAKDPFYRFPRQKLLEWANLVVLDLDFGGEHIDIGPLTCLRSLHLKADHNLKTFTCTNRFVQQLQFVKFQCMLGLVKEMPSFTSTQLQELEINMSMCSLPKAVTLPPASGSLTILRLSQWYSSSRHHDLDLGVFPNLTEVMIESYFWQHSYIGCELSISGLKNLTKLKHLCLRKLPIVGRLHGLENMTGLETLTLQCCLKITSLPGLGSLTKLIVLSVSLTAVEDLSGVEQLLKLQELHCIGCGHLRSLPDLRALPDLHVVHVDSSLKNVRVSESCNVHAPDMQVSASFVTRNMMDPVRSARGLLNVIPFPQGGTDAGFSGGLGVFGPNRGIIAQLPRDSSTTPLLRSNGADATADRARDWVNLQLDEIERARSHPAWHAEKYASSMRIVKDAFRHTSIVEQLKVAIFVSLVCVILALMGVILGFLIVVMLVGVLSILIGSVTLFVGRDFVRHVWRSLSTVQRARDVTFWSSICIFGGALGSILLVVSSPVVLLLGSIYVVRLIIRLVIGLVSLALGIIFVVFSMLIAVSLACVQLVLSCICACCQL